jgi:Fuc2NAc and GlcNAc transferase
VIFELIIYAAIASLTYYGVTIMRVWTQRRKLLDIPNERSLHNQLTPRGGGLMIVFISLFFYFVYTFFYTRSFSWSYFTGALLVAFISWLDDLYSISIGWRLLLQASAAILIITTYFHRVSEDNSLWLTVENGKFLYLILGFLWIVWMTNAYNFMDGIDGIAAVQAVSAGIGWLIIGKSLDSPAIAIYGGVIAFSAAGFIFHNWQPAKIFMGDVGSTFLGFTFAAMPFLAAENNSSGFEKWHWAGIILLWLFLFDTIFTFVRRLLKGEKFWQAHCCHLYQQLVINGFSHKFVALLYGGLAFFNVVLITYSFYQPKFIYILYTGIGLESFGLIGLSIWSGKKNVFTKTLLL